MKKRYIVSAVGAASATAAGYFLKNKDNRDKVIEKTKNITDKVKNYRNKSNTTFEDAGMPDQSADKDLAQLENAKMVSEGSQFGVQYYNEHKEENTNDNYNSERI